MSRRPQPAQPQHQPTPTLIVGSGRHQQTLQLGDTGSVRLGGRAVDVCFVFDTTGSMTDKIEGLITTMSELVRELGEFDLDWRTTVVPFGDLKVPGDRIVDDLPFVDTVDAAVGQLSELPRFSGGGNRGESSIEALQAALAKPFRPGAVKVLVVLTDEHAHQDRTPASILEGQLLEADAIAFVLSPPTRYYRSWATATAGHWYEISATARPETVLELLRSLCRDIAAVSAKVHELAGGSVAAYRALPAGGRGGR
jgi:hypothetical protein